MVLELQDPYGASTILKMSWLLDEACHKIIGHLQNIIDMREEHKREWKVTAESKVHLKENLENEIPLIDATDEDFVIKVSSIENPKITINSTDDLADEDVVEVSHIGLDRAIDANIRNDQNESIEDPSEENLSIDDSIITQALKFDIMSQIEDPFNLNEETTKD